MSENQFFFEGNRKNSWYGLIIMVIVLILLYFLVTSLFKILYFLSPLLLLLTLIFDYQVVVKFGKMILRLFKRNWLFGILVSVLSILAFPILTGGLFVNALMNWRLKRAARKGGFPIREEKDRFSKYEIIEEEGLDLDDQEKVKIKKG